MNIITTNILLFIGDVINKSAVTTTTTTETSEHPTGRTQLRQFLVSRSRPQAVPFITTRPRSGDEEAGHPREPTPQDGRAQELFVFHACTAA